MALSELSRQTFIQYLGGLYTNSAWVLERVYNAGMLPEHDDPELLARALKKVISESSTAEKIALLQSYRAGSFNARATRNVVARKNHRVSAASDASAVASDSNTADSEESERLGELHKQYRSKFGFPIVVAADDASPVSLLRTLEQRLEHSPAEEFAHALDELHRVARSRLDQLLEKRSDDDIESDTSSATSAHIANAQHRDPDYFPGLVRGVPLGIQHVLAMFVSNVTPAIIIAGAVGFGFGSADTTDMIYMIQMSMFFAGIATLIQTIGFGPVGARLPIVQGTSFAFIPIMIPIAKVYGMAALMGGIVIGGIFHFFLGTVIGRIRHWLPPLVTGLVVLMIGLALIKVGIQYAAGGVPLMGSPAYGALTNWGLALIVIVVTLGLKFFTRGMLSVSAVLLGLSVGYLAAFALGEVDFTGIDRAVWFALPNPLHFGFEVNIAAVIGMCLMGVVSAIETVGDISGITKGGAGREATEHEVAGGTMADGVGTALSGLFGALPNTSFSQNVGLISMTGLMSRHVVTLGALFLVLCGLMPKVGAAIQTMPIAVLGGGVIVMFGMVAAAGVNMLAEVHWNRRNQVIFAVALSVGLGLQLEPGALQHVSPTLKVLMTSGLLPAALIAIVLDRVIPAERMTVQEDTNR